jgi:hypothetical protein
MAGHNQENTIGTDLNLSSPGHSIFNEAPCPPGLRHHTIPIAEAARRLRGLVQPRFIPPVETVALPLQLDCFQPLGIKRYTLGVSCLSGCFSTLPDVV